MRDIELTLSGNEYFTLNEIAIKNNTTIEEIVNKYLKMCVEENGWIIYDRNFEKGYTVLKTKEEVQAYLKK